MSGDTVTGGHGGSYGLWRWLVGGLAGGGVVLGLLIAAYAIGYHRGERRSASAAAATSTTPAATTTTAASQSAGPVTPTPVLVARGHALYTSDGCVACHSLTGTAGAGPALNGLFDSAVTLTDGSTVKADVAYLEQSITDADAQIVKGYRAGVMPAAIASFALGSKLADVRALVAYLESKK